MLLRTPLIVCPLLFVPADLGKSDWPLRVLRPITGLCEMRLLCWEQAMFEGKAKKDAVVPRAACMSRAPLADASFLKTFFLSFFQKDNNLHFFSIIFFKEKKEKDDLDCREWSECCLQVDTPRAALGFGRPWLVRGSSVVGIGLCTLDLYWDPLASAIVLRQLDRPWAETCVACGGQLACCSHCMQRSGASHCARALPSLTCVFVFSS